MPESRDWAYLPSELIHIIYRKLPPDLLCIVHFRAVCKNWRSFTILSDLAPRIPWLIECDYPSRNSHLEPNLRFYSLVGGNTGTIRVPKPHHGMVYCGPGHGNLLVSSPEDEIYLLNLLTGGVKSLPKLDHEQMVRSLVFCSSDPIQNWHLVSCGMNSSVTPRWRSVIYNTDENDWTYLDLFECCISCNTSCWDGKVFVLEDLLSLAVYDAASGERLYVVKPPADEDSQVSTTYLVESCGEILRLSLYPASDEADEVEFPLFDIYKLYSDGEGKYSWVEVSEIGDQVVFLDLMNGFSMRASAGFEGNCIYFLLEDGSTPCRYDIGTKTTERVPCPFKNCTWFVPNLG